jgi:hypothetical protein
MKDKKVKQVLYGDGYQWEHRGWTERMNEGKYSGVILYICMKIDQGNLSKLF